MTGGRTAAEPSAARIWLKIIGFLIALVAGLFLAQQAGDFFHGGGAQARLAANLDTAAKRIREQAPIKVDDVTTLNGAASIGDTIIYTMSLAQDIPTAKLAAAQAWMQQTDTKRACADADIRKLIAAGGKMRWIYTDAKGDQFQANLAKCP